MVLYSYSMARGRDATILEIDKEQILSNLKAIVLPK